jgi:hypothetical protein
MRQTSSNTRHITSGPDKICLSRYHNFTFTTKWGRYIDLVLIDVPTNRPTKRGKEKSPSDGHCQCEKEMEDHLLAWQ